MKPRTLLFCTLIGHVGMTACADPPPQLELEIVATYPHDTGAFTQGLLWYEGELFESTGLYGQSSLREVEINTGIVMRQTDLSNAYFAEGLALVGNDLYQLTWREHVALIYDRDTFQSIDSFDYTGEGWGLTHDGENLIMSDGSSTLEWRDPATFAVVKSLTVTNDGSPQTFLNELEYANGQIYANVWQSDTIVVIDPTSGEVVAEIDASGLLTPEEDAAADVLNGIAYNPTTGNFYITGKLWPHLYEVRFVSPNDNSGVLVSSAEVH